MTYHSSIDLIQVGIDWLAWDTYDWIGCLSIKPKEGQEENTEQPRQDYSIILCFITSVMHEYQDAALLVMTSSFHN